MIWFERRVIGRMQQRPGPNRNGPFGLLQSLADGVKSMLKEDVRPKAADAVVFTLAPIVFAAIPMSRWLGVVRLWAIMKVFRRSSRSIMYSAMKPPTTAMTPGAMLAIRAALALKPDSMSTICP